MTVPIEDNELREQTRRSIARLISIQRGDETWNDEDYITAGNILLVCNRLVREGQAARTARKETEARLQDFRRMRDYYGRGNIKLWNEDDMFREVYLDDHIAELEQKLNDNATPTT